LQGCANNNFQNLSSGIEVPNQINPFPDQEQVPETPNRSIELNNTENEFSGEENTSQEQNKSVVEINSSNIPAENITISNVPDITDSSAAAKENIT